MAKKAVYQNLVAFRINAPKFENTIGDIYG